MNADTNKLDQILSAIGLKRVMLWQSSFRSVYDESKFKSYVTSAYRNSSLRESDEVYRMFELNLLHMDTGLRLTLTTSESYDGETVEYKVIGLFIITSSNKELEVIDVDFQKKIFFTTESQVPFSKTSKVIQE